MIFWRILCFKPSLEPSDAWLIVDPYHRHPFSLKMMTTNPCVVVNYSHSQKLWHLNDQHNPFRGTSRKPTLRDN